MIFTTSKARAAKTAAASPDRHADNKDLSRGAEFATAQPTSKIAAIQALMQRTEGASLEEMVAATGWLPHTTRAALTSLRKKGHSITRDKREGASYYHLAPAISRRGPKTSS